MNTIAREFPLAAVLSRQFQEFYCTTCFGELSNCEVLACDDCLEVAYCSLKCQRKDWNTVHQFECEILRSQNTPMTPTMRLCVRVLIQKFSGKTNCSSFNGASIDDLETNYKEFRSSPAHNQFLSDVLAIISAAGYSFLPEKLDTNKTIAVICSILCNSFGIIDEKRVEPIGTGLYVGMAKHNHSCAAKCHVVFEKNQVILRSPSDGYFDDFTAVNSDSEASTSTTTTTPHHPKMLNINDQNVFGTFQKLQKFSPFNCGAPQPFRFIFTIFTAISALSMLFRTYWMFWQIGSESLEFGWAESQLYGFISFESFCITIGLYRITSKRSLCRFTENMQRLKSLRVSKNFHEKFDNYRTLYIRLFIAVTFNFAAFTLSAIYLVSHKMVTYGGAKSSHWYWIMDPIVAILCGYANFLFLPTHSLLHHQMAREFDVFNDEMEQVSKKNMLANRETLRNFANRQLKLFEFTNTMTARMDKLMIWAPFFTLMALLMGTYIISVFAKTPKVLYLLCIIALTISTFFMSLTLLYPIAFVQESMSKTSSILLNDSLVQTSDDPLVYQTYRVIMDRCMYNRACNNVLNVFTVTRKNIERVFFVHSLVIVAMIVVHSFEVGVEDELVLLEKIVSIGG
uniref:MYND-type domain-containing protein n=1 Tax=Caenorhabditis japonica TaxID=281687 RepID=A0A8R1HVG2_CAEJA